MSDSLPYIPAENNGDQLFFARGSFWTTFLYEKNALRSFFQGSGQALDQQTLDYMETNASLSRATLPTYHRNRLRRYVIRLSGRRTGLPLRCGMEGVVVGPQPTDSEYTPSAVFDVGGDASWQDIYGYDLDPAPMRTPQFIYSTPAGSTTMLQHGTDFYYQEGRVFFPKEKDPFTIGFTVAPIVVDNETDHVVALWATDVLDDYAFQYDHFGAMLNLRLPSSAHYDRVIQALYDLRYLGPTVAATTRAAAAVLGLPVTGMQPETVTEILTDSTGTKIVTDTAVYTVELTQTVAPAVAQDAVLPPGSLLADTLKIYRKPGMVDSADKFYAANGVSLDSFIADVPKLRLPPGLLSGTGGVALIAPWGDTQLLSAGLDVNGNPKLWFELEGTAEAVAAYWASVWLKAETAGTNLETVFADYITVTGVTAAIRGTINPMKFYLQNFMRSNTQIMTVDLATLPSYITSLNLLTELPRLLPAHSLLLVIGHGSTEDTSSYDLTDAAEVLTPVYSSQQADSCMAGMPSGTNLTYADNITCRMIRR